MFRALWYWSVLIDRGWHLATGSRTNASLQQLGVFPFSQERMIQQLKFRITVSQQSKDQRTTIYLSCLDATNQIPAVFTHCRFSPAVPEVRKRNASDAHSTRVVHYHYYQVSVHLKYFCELSPRGDWSLNL